MLKDQRAVVVGGTSGIGLATAIELSRSGAQVWLTGRTPEKTTAAAASIGDRVTGCAVDARDAAKLEAFFARVGEFNHLIVALGGGSAIGAFKDLDEAKMRAGFDNKFWPYLNAVRLWSGSYSRFRIDHVDHGRRRTPCHQGHVRIRRGERRFASNHRPFGPGIRADPRQCGIAWLDCHSLLGSHARGCPESDVRAFGRNRSSRPRRCARRCRACCPVPC